MISATVVLLLLTLQLCICDSVRPTFIAVATFLFQVTLTNTPAYPTFSDYYFTEWRLPHIIILGALLLAAIVFFVVRKKLWRGLRSRNTGLMLSLLLLTAALLLNGFGSDTWTPDGFLLGALIGLFYLFVFTFFYLGISEENDENELLDYVTYIAFIITLMLIAQLVHLFITGEVIVDGSIVKNSVLLGWATCNPLGTMFVTMIPILFYGAMTKKNGIIYFLATTASLIAAISTCSRNALLFGVLTYGVCLLIVAFGAPRKWQRIAGRIAIGIGVAGAIAAGVIFWDKISLLFASFLNQGSDDNGRFYLWALAWDNFMENKIFGAGFFALGSELTGVTVEGMPSMAHNTVLEFLSSTGVIGTAAYLFYRVRTIMPLIERSTLGKSMLGFTYLIIVLTSLLDVFVFAFYPMFFPMIAMAVACRIYDIQCSRE